MTTLVYVARKVAICEIMRRSTMKVKYRGYELDVQEIREVQSSGTPSPNAKTVFVYAPNGRPLRKFPSMEEAKRFVDGKISHSD